MTDAQQSDTPDETVVPPLGMHSGSQLEQVLRAGHFAITAEMPPPDSADPEHVFRNVEPLLGHVDAINATDASGAHVHMASQAVCALLASKGYEPVQQISCRDKNRIAIQGDVLGGAALGIKTMLCLTGDGVGVGDHPESKPVFDLDSVSLLQMIKIMRDRGTFLSGRALETPPKVFLGAASNPFVPPYDWRPLRLLKKAQAGADFVQTQYCYDIPRLKAFMQRVVDMGLHEKVFILIGVGPLRSAKGAEFMRTQVPGIHIPDNVVQRMADAPKKQRKAEGRKICVELIQQVREIEGVHGVHIMAYKMEEMVPDICAEAGIAIADRSKQATTPD